MSISKEKDKEDNHRQKVLRHADGVRQQVRERELQAIAQRREVFKEGDRLDEEARQRRIRLDEIKEKKLRELKLVNCNRIDRALHKAFYIVETTVRGNFQCAKSIRVHSFFFQGCWTSRKILQ